LATLTLSTNISLSAAQAVVCSGAATAPTPTGLAAGTTAIACPTGTTSRAAFSGTLAIGTTNINVAGTYTSSSIWAIDAYIATLALNSNISLTKAQAVVCSGAATAPTPSGLATGTTAITCPGSTGITAAFSGTFTFNGSLLKVSGSYIGANDWWLGISSGGTLTLANTATTKVSLSGASLAVCNTSNGVLGAGFSSLCVTGGRSGVVGGFSGTFVFNGTSIPVSGSFQSSSIWSLTATYLTSLRISSSLTLTNPFLGLKASGGVPVVIVGGNLQFGTRTLVVSGGILTPINWTLHGAFRSTSSGSNISLGSGVTISNLILTISLSGGRPSGAIDGTLNLGTRSLKISGSYDNARNWSLSASAGGSLSFSGVTITSPSIYVADVNGVISYAPPGSLLPAGSLSIQGTVNLPPSLSTVVGFSSIAGEVQYNPTSGSWSAILTANTGDKETIQDVTFNFLSTKLTLAYSGAAISASIAETGSISIGNGDGTSTVIGARLGFTLAADGTINFAVTALPTSPGAPVWANAFGYRDFNLLSLNLSVGYAGGFPTLGVQASASLPQSLMKEVGGDGTAIVSVAANLSSTTPCAQFTLSPGVGSTNVINIGHGVLTAQSAKFGIAPAGCTIGDFTMTPGISVAFSGAVLGTTVSANLNVAMNGPIFTIDGTIAVGSVSFNGVSFGGGTATVSLTNAPGGTESFSFSTSSTFLGVSSTTSMNARYVLGTTTGSVSMTSQLTNATINGFGFNDLYWSFDATTVSTPNFAVSFYAKMSVDNGGDGITVQGSASPTSFSLSGVGTLNISGFSLNATLTASGSLSSNPSISANLKANINALGLNAVASGDFTSTINAQGNPVVTGNLTVTSSLRIGSLTASGVQATIYLGPSGDGLRFQFAPSISGFSLGSANLYVNYLNNSIGYSGTFTINDMTLGGGASYSGGSLTITNCSSTNSAGFCTSVSSAVPSFTVSFGTLTLPYIGTLNGPTYVLNNDLSFDYQVNTSFSNSTSYSKGGFNVTKLVYVNGIDVTVSLSGNIYVDVTQNGVSSSAGNLTGSASVNWGGVNVQSVGSGYAKFSRGVGFSVGWDSTGAYVSTNNVDTGSVTVAGVKVFNGMTLGGQKTYFFSF
jgi:hypothetical protein